MEKENGNYYNGLYRVWDFRVLWGLGLKVWGSRFRLYRVGGSRFRAQGWGLGVQV